MSDISILYSGGPDSTLAALYALDRAKRVHLLTYHHRYMGAIGKHRKVVAELRETFGPERIVVHEQETDRMLRECYLTGISKKLARYRTFYVPWICGACKMAMHAATIAYNQKHGITLTYCGANRESSRLFPAQMDTYIRVMQEFYRSYGMEYEVPVYDVVATDVETEKRGLKTTKNTKREHVVYSTQHACPIGLLIHAHGRLYYRPFRGKERARRLSGPFLGEMLQDCADVLPEHVAPPERHP